MLGMSVDVAEKLSVLRSRMHHLVCGLFVIAWSICAAIADVCDDWCNALFSSGEA